MTLRTPKVFSSYGALDSDALADGRPSDAQVLRTLAMSSNRLATRGQPLAQVIFNTTEEADALITLNGWHKGWGTPFWIQVTPRIPIVKKPLITRAKLFWRIAASDDGLMGVQVATDAAPFDPRARVYLAPNVFGFTGSSSPPYGEVSNVHRHIPLREGPTESVTYYVRATLGAEGDEGTYGEPSSGTIEKVHGERDYLDVDGASWTVNGWADNGHAVAFRQSTGTAPVEPRWITRNGEGYLRIFPPLPDDKTADSLEGAEFIIRKLPMWRIYGLSLYAEQVEL